MFPEVPGKRRSPADRVGLAGYAQNRIFAVPGPGPGRVLVIRTCGKSFVVGIVRLKKLENIVSDESEISVYDCI